MIFMQLYSILDSEMLREVLAEDGGKYSRKKGGLPSEMIEKPLSKKDFGADEQIRTAYLFITNEVLYQLSYISLFNFYTDECLLTNEVLYQLSYISLFFCVSLGDLYII